MEVRKLLEGKKDQFGGFIVDDTQLPDTNEFEDILKGINLRICFKL